jgi:hypothetical protein
MTVVAKIFVDDDSVIPLADGTGREMMVNHSDRIIDPYLKKRLWSRQTGSPGFPFKNPIRDCQGYIK